MPTVPAPEHEERPERMRDWICRMVDSGRFHGLEWINPEKTIFRVPWIHAKKRGYCKERDAALFREWALHSGKYRDESDPTVWKINFRCAINGLKDIMEIKDLQTEDCRVYKVLPSRRTRRKPRRRFPNVEPYGPIMTPQSKFFATLFSNIA
jgi:interferon regulatory factor 1